MLHKRSGEVEKPKQGEVGEVILERSEVDSVGVKVCQYPVELKGKEGAGVNPTCWVTSPIC